MYPYMQTIRNLFNMDGPKGRKTHCILILGGLSTDDRFQIWISELS